MLQTLTHKINSARTQTPQFSGLIVLQTLTCQIKDMWTQTDQFSGPIVVQILTCQIGNMPTQIDQFRGPIAIAIAEWCKSSHVRLKMCVRKSISLADLYL